MSQFSLWIPPAPGPWGRDERQAQRQPDESTKAILLLSASKLPEQREQNSHNGLPASVDNGDHYFSNSGADSSSNLGAQRWLSANATT
jgi:hypothetical protein